MKKENSIITLQRTKLVVVDELDGDGNKKIVKSDVQRLLLDDHDSDNIDQA